MAMGSFSYTDNVRAAFASCLPCFTASRPASTSNSPANSSSNAINTTLSEPRPPLTATRPSPSSNDLEYLLRDSDSDALSLHSNLGATGHRRARRRRRPKFSLTLFGYTLFGRPPIYLSDEDDGDGSPNVDGGRRRVLVTASSSTLDSDATPLDASTIERLTSPDHYAALAAQRESERLRLAEEEARRKAERRARRQERKARERASALMSLNATLPHQDTDTFEDFQGSENRMGSTSFPFHPDVVRDHPDPTRLRRDGDFDGSNASHSGEADDADLGGELYTRKKKISAALSASGSDSRSRTSVSLSNGDTSHTQNLPIHGTHQSIPYPHTEMRLPAPARKKSHRPSKRTSTVSSVTSQSTSTAPYTPVESIAETPAVAPLPAPHERDVRDVGYADFPSTGLSGKRRPKSLDPKAFLAHQG